MKTLLVVVFLLALGSPSLTGQDHPPNASKALVWSLLQVAPSFSWTGFPAATHFAFEWEATPLLYSFGMTRLVSPWRSFYVPPAARYTGSVELLVSGQLYTTSPGASRFGYSAQLQGHIPLVERGEYLALTLGGALYRLNGRTEPFIVGGVSGVFGFLQATIKYAPGSDRWMTSLELRFF